MYVGITRNEGLNVPDDQALGFAMSACGVMRPSFTVRTDDVEAFDKFLVEWFYSGNWIHVVDEEEETREDVGVPGRMRALPEGEG